MEDIGSEARCATESMNTTNSHGAQSRQMKFYQLYKLSRASFSYVGGWLVQFAAPMFHICQVLLKTANRFTVDEVGHMLLMQIVGSTELRSAYVRQ